VTNKSFCGHCFELSGVYGNTQASFLSRLRFFDHQMNNALNIAELSKLRVGGMSPTHTAALPSTDIIAILTGSREIWIC
jgi:hypothetical protein